MGNYEKSLYQLMNPDQVEVFCQEYVKGYIPTKEFSPEQLEKLKK